MIDRTQESLLEQAQHAVKEAKQLEQVGRDGSAQKHWQIAESAYMEAGVDPHWFDDGFLHKQQYRPKHPMLLRENCDDDRIAFVCLVAKTAENDPSITVDIDDLVSVELDSE